jgi:hypothetical protein
MTPYGLPSTKRFVDDRFGYCEYEAGESGGVCTALLAEGDLVTVVTARWIGDAYYEDVPDAGDFVPALTDLLLA